MQGNRASQCRIKIVNQCMKLALFSVHNIKNQANKEKTVYYIFFRVHTIPIGHLFTNKNGDFGAISVTEREFLHLVQSLPVTCDHMSSF